MSGRKAGIGALGLLIVMLAAACDNVDWGGTEFAIVPPPPKGSGPAEGVEGGGEVEPLPDNPLLYYVRRTREGATLLPIAEIMGDELRPIAAGDNADAFGRRFIAEHFRQGTEYTLFRRGARVGTFVVGDAEIPSIAGCDRLPRATGYVELTSAAGEANEFLALSKRYAPGVRRRIPETLEPTRTMQVIGPILAERMLRARNAQLPGNWYRAMAQLQPFPLEGRTDAAFAATFLVGDTLGTGGFGQGVAYSLFFVAVPQPPTGFDTAYVAFTDYTRGTKAAPRVVDYLDWDRDDQVELLLEVYGVSGSRFAAVGQADGEWTAILQGACERRIERAAPVDTAAAADTVVALGRPVHTYSIVARDAETGQLGVAVQSHWFSVGSSVAWAEAGVGAVATQSFIDPSYGPLGLDLMRAGRSAEQALAGLLVADEHPDVRQLGMVDAAGGVAAHTGRLAIPEAGHILGDGYAVQANLMLKPTVPGAMARAYEAADGDLAARLMAALRAAQAEGGDIRGAQSAALLVVSGEPTGRPWADRVFDLRVEDDARPLDELDRLLHLARAYRHMNAGDEALTEGDVERAVAEYGAAQAMVPDSVTNGEMAFWHAVTLASAGRIEESLPLFRRAFAQDENWAELLRRLPGVGQFPEDPELLARILRMAR